MIMHHRTKKANGKQNFDGRFLYGGRVGKMIESVGEQGR
jgi:hypothetical protein